MHRLVLHNSLLTPRSIQNSFSRYGCNMRTLYEVLVRGEEASIVEDLHKKIKNHTLSEIHKMLVTGHEASERTSHSISTTKCEHQPQPEESAYTQSDKVTYAISGSAVEVALLAEHAVARHSKVAEMLTLFQGVPPTASSAGHLWEEICHARLSKGGSYPLIRMIPERGYLVPSRSDIEPIKIVPMIYTKLKLSNPSDLICNPGEYYVPVAKNNPTFDSFFFLEQKQIAIQITLSSSRSFEPKGLTVLEDLQPEGNYGAYFIFVVPTSSAETFRCKVPANVQDKFDFFLLEMKQDPCKHSPSSEGICKLKGSLATSLVMIPSGGANANVKGEEESTESGKGSSSGSPSKSAYSWCQHLLRIHTRTQERG
jgi:hypothetical protein